jgi:hypothetical protein
MIFAVGIAQAPSAVWFVKNNRLPMPCRIGFPGYPAFTLPSERKGADR